jgi:hypothetical protein
MKRIYWNQFSGPGNIAHLAFYNSVTGFCVCAALLTNTEALFGEKRSGKHV